jgi:hypothetical protein
LHYTLFNGNASSPDPNGSNIFTAASCSHTDVDDCLNGTGANTCHLPGGSTGTHTAANGDTIFIPAGTCHWTTGIKSILSGSLTIMGAGNQTLGGGDMTVIVDDINVTDGSDPPLLALATAAGQTVRLTGLTIQGGAMSLTSNGAVRIHGNSEAVRVDHNHFNSVTDQSLTLGGCEYGVVDHNLFDYHKTQVTVRYDNCNGEIDGNGDQSWALPTNFGSSQFIFIEDNVFNGTSSVAGGGAADDCDHGGRLVFRHNQLNAANIQGHEMEDRGQGCRAQEIYANVISVPNLQGSFYYTRTGTSLIWGNTLSGTIVMVGAHNDRSETNNANYQPPPTSWGKCGTVLGPSAWDGNTDSTGYPCFNQVGRGKGDLLELQFPQAMDAIMGRITFPHEALEPVYAWGNKFTCPERQQCTYFGVGAPERGLIVENRDYYVELPNYDEPNSTFNGTAGIGQGLLSARPASCTPLTGYWASDTQTLYQCQTPNTWTEYYTPYIYPHPLAVSTSP